MEATLFPPLRVDFPVFLSKNLRFFSKKKKKYYYKDNFFQKAKRKIKTGAFIITFFQSAPSRAQE